MTGPSLIVARLCRAIVGVLRSDEVTLPVVSKAVRALVLVPVFGTLHLWMRARAVFAGRLFTTARVDDLRFEVGFPDFVQTYLYLFGTWEPDITAFVRSRLRPGDTFVDVGANIGYYTGVSSGLVGDDGRVVAVEASPAIHEVLLRTVENNALGNVRAVNVAASDHHGAIEIYRGPDRNTGLTTPLPSRGLACEATVACAPLGDILTSDEIATTRIIKVDVEGAEPAVLAGVVDLLPRLRRDVEIVVELSPAWWEDDDLLPTDVLEPFLAAGFHVFEVRNNLWPWRYLWPNAARPPFRATSDLSKKPKRFDLVLSRTDAPKLWPTRRTDG